MPRAHPLLLIPALCGALAACSSSGGGGDRFDSFAELDAYGSDLQAVVDDLGYTDPASLPAGGTASYQGVIGLDVADIPNVGDNVYDMGGELTLVADFDEDSVEGSATNFYTADEEDIDGTLEIAFGDIYRDADTRFDYTFDAILDGVLTDSEGDELAIEADLLGDFYGDGWSHVAGDVEGEACLGASCSDLEGGFVGERD